MKRLVKILGVTLAIVMFACVAMSCGSKLDLKKVYVSPDFKSATLVNKQEISIGTAADNVTDIEINEDMLTYKKTIEETTACYFYDLVNSKPIENLNSKDNTAFEFTSGNSIVLQRTFKVNDLPVTKTALFSRKGVMIIPFSEEALSFDNNGSRNVEALGTKGEYFVYSGEVIKVDDTTAKTIISGYPQLSYSLANGGTIVGELENFVAVFNSNGEEIYSINLEQDSSFAVLSDSTALLATQKIMPEYGKDYSFYSQGQKIKNTFQLITFKNDKRKDIKLNYAQIMIEDIAGTLNSEDIKIYNEDFLKKNVLCSVIKINKDKTLSPIIKVAFHDAKTFALKGEEEDGVVTRIKLANGNYVNTTFEQTNQLADKKGKVIRSFNGMLSNFSEDGKVMAYADGNETYFYDTDGKLVLNSREYTYTDGNFIDGKILVSKAVNGIEEFAIVDLASGYTKINLAENEVLSPLRGYEGAYQLEDANGFKGIYNYNLVKIIDKADIKNTSKDFDFISSENSTKNNLVYITYFTDTNECKVIKLSA